MGIHEFGKLIKQYPDIVITKNFKNGDMENKINFLAIDISEYAYKFSYSKSTKTNKNEYIRKFFNFFVKLLLNGIIPIAVFDGAPTQLKSETIKQRKTIKQNQQQEIKQIEKKISDSKDITQQLLLTEQLTSKKAKIINISQETFDNIKHLCKLMGIPIIQSEQEADLVIAVIIGDIVDYALSDDYDMFAYGTGGLKKIYRNYNPMQDTIDEYDYQLLLKKMNIDSHQLSDICVLAGCDYTSTKMSINKAVKIIKQYENLEKYLEMNPDINPKHRQEYLEASNYFKHIGYFHENDRQYQSICEKMGGRNLYGSGFELQKYDFAGLYPFLISKCNFRQSTIDKWTAQLLENSTVYNKTDFILHTIKSEYGLEIYGHQHEKKITINKIKDFDNMKSIFCLSIISKNTEIDIFMDQLRDVVKLWFKVFLNNCDKTKKLLEQEHINEIDYSKNIVFTKHIIENKEKIYNLHKYCLYSEINLKELKYETHLENIRFDKLIEKEENFNKLPLKLFDSFIVSLNGDIYH
jgi:5'-3' exonuclease